MYSDCFCYIYALTWTFSSIPAPAATHEPTALCVVRQKVLSALKGNRIDPEVGVNETRKLLCKPMARVDHFRVASVNEA